jgi:Zn-dependent protease with chaperone function
MNGRKKMSIALFVGALVVFVASVFVLTGGHNKAGIGLIVLGVILVGLSVVAFLSRSTTEGQLTEWM